MKIFNTIVLSLLSISMFAQENFTAPHSWRFDDAQLASLEILDVGTIDLEAVVAEDWELEHEVGMDNYGRLMSENITPNNAGTWTHFDDGSKLWRLKFESQDALALSVFFNDYYIPEGGKLWLWTHDKSFFVGPYDHTENNDHGQMATANVYDDLAVLEYYQPADAVGELKLSTHGFGHYYTNIYDYRDGANRGGSQPCQIDVKCPEGDGYKGQIDATVRLRILDGIYIGACSGVMVNNLNKDCRQLLLTAFHCTNGLSNSELQSLQVYFNNERTGCLTGADISTHNRTGLIELGRSNDNNGQTGSDFAIYEVEDEINPAWDIYYAGWNATGSGSAWGVGIHHPSGDSKKISTYSNPVVSDSWGFASGSHWRVQWVETETEHGVTEPGSSGSPLFDTFGRVIGTLTGGGSCCEGSEGTFPGCIGEDSPDFYGKVSYHWDSNNNASTDLKEILDPEDTGHEILFGAFAPDCSVPWLQVVELEFDDVNIYPNPTTNRVSFSLPQRFKLATIQIYNAMGQLVNTENPRFNSGEIELRNYSEGIYYLTFTTEDGQQVTKKLTVI